MSMPRQGALRQDCSSNWSGTRHGDLAAALLLIETQSGMTGSLQMRGKWNGVVRCWASLVKFLKHCFSRGPYLVRIAVILLILIKVIK